MILKTDCRFFRGDVPCKPHKLFGVHCDECTHYVPAPQRVLIIKLGAIGDVIRTTTLLTPLRNAYPNAMIYWLTYSPDVLPEAVDLKMNVTLENILAIEETEFDYAINLDKEREACAILNRVKAKVKKGFMLKAGKCTPIDESGNHKFYTGVFDDVSQANTQSYPTEIFDIAGFKFTGENYVLDNLEAGKNHWNLDPQKPVVGLNTGCGGRWKTRLWADESWIAVAKTLMAQGCDVVLLGGEQEHEKNLALAQATGAKYFGFFSLKTFIDLIDHCTVVITQVTMAMHLALGRKKNLILLNNIFNRHEFELYGRGEIIEPTSGCECFYAPSCKREARSEVHCMKDISPERVTAAALRQIHPKVPGKA
jgi:ADP-heptose:LPS heptosyltransferase